MTDFTKTKKIRRTNNNADMWNMFDNEIKSSSEKSIECITIIL